LKICLAKKNGAGTFKGAWLRNIPYFLNWESKKCPTVLFPFFKAGKELKARVDY
jgi:hypothetical protein